MKRRSMKGFSLIEMAVVIGILAVVSGAVISVNRSVRVNAGFFRESSRLLESFLEARSQSLFTGSRPELGQSGGGVVEQLVGGCGYGINLFLAGEPDPDPNHPPTHTHDGFIVFRDRFNRNIGYDCDYQYQYQRNEQLSFFSLPAQVFEFEFMRYQASPSLPVRNVVFQAYDGTATCDGTDCPLQTIICLETSDSSVSISRRLVISKFGSISMDAVPC